MAAKKIFLRHNRRGFTLMEVMTVIAIMGIFSSLTIINFRANEKQRDIRNAGLLLIDGLKRVQTMAFSGALIGVQAPSYYRFSFAGNCVSGCSYRLLGDETQIDDVAFDPHISVSVDGSSGGDVSIDFYPPRANSVATVESLEKTEAVFRLNYGEGELTPVCVVFNSVSGRIDLKTCP